MAVKIDQYQTIGKIVCFHRKKAGLTQNQLANLAGLGKTAIFDVENGKISIRFSTLIKIFYVLNIQLSLDSPLIQAGTGGVYGKFSLQTYTPGKLH